MQSRIVFRTMWLLGELFDNISMPELFKKIMKINFISQIPLRGSIFRQQEKKKNKKQEGISEEVKIWKKD